MSSVTFSFEGTVLQNRPPGNILIWFDRDRTGKAPNSALEPTVSTAAAVLRRPGRGSYPRTGIPVTKQPPIRSRLP